MDCVGVMRLIWVVVMTVVYLARVLSSSAEAALVLGFVVLASVFVSWVLPNVRPESILSVGLVTVFWVTVLVSMSVVYRCEVVVTVWVCKELVSSVGMEPVT